MFTRLMLLAVAATWGMMTLPPAAHADVPSTTTERGWAT